MSIEKPFKMRWFSVDCINAGVCDVRWGRSIQAAMFFRDEITGIKKAPDVGLFLLLNSGGPDGTRTRDLRRDRPAF